MFKKLPNRYQCDRCEHVVIAAEAPEKCSVCDQGREHSWGHYIDAAKQAAENPLNQAIAKEAFRQLRERKWR